MAENDPTPHKVVHVAEYDPILAGTNGYNPQAKAWILVAIRGINDWLMLKVDYVEGNPYGAEFAASAGE